MNIKEASDYTGISKDMIRFYEKKGLITPTHNPDNNYREYTLADIYHLVSIKQYSTLGIRLDTIAKMLQKEDISTAVEELDQSIANSKEELRWLSERIDSAEDMKEILKLITNEESFQILKRDSICFYPNLAENTYNVAANFVRGGVFRPIFVMDRSSKEAVLTSGMMFQNPIPDYSGTYERYQDLTLFRTTVTIPRNRAVITKDLKATDRSIRKQGYTPLDFLIGYEILTKKSTESTVILEIPIQ